VPQADDVEKLRNAVEDPVVTETVEPVPPDPQD